MPGAANASLHLQVKLSVAGSELGNIVRRAATNINSILPIIFFSINGLCTEYVGIPCSVTCKVSQRTPTQHEIKVNLLIW